VWPGYPPLGLTDVTGLTGQQGQTGTVEHLSRADRVARGKDARAVAPLESHAEFSPGPGRDPVGLERFDMTAPIVFTVAGVLLTHGPLAPLGIAPSSEMEKVLTEATLALVLFSDAGRVRLHQLRADLGLCLRLLGIGLPLAIGLGTLLAFILPGVNDIWLALLIATPRGPAGPAARPELARPNNT
jgi:hypothetical protein